MAPSDRQFGKQVSTGFVWLGLFVVAAALVLAAGFTTLKGSDGKAAVAQRTAFPSAQSTGTKPSPKPTATSITIAAAGDLMADQAIKSFIQTNGAAAVLADVAPLLKAADLALVNLESPLSDQGSRQTWKDVTFRGEPRMVDGLVSAGIDVVTMANNHAVDFGDAALLDTLARLDKAEIAVTGAGKNDAAAFAPAILTTKGVKVAFLGYSDILPQGYLAGDGPGIVGARVDIPRVIRAITAASTRADFVVVSFHWGVEYDQTANADQIAEAHAAIDAGADLVMSSHPHVLEGLETYNGGLIAYSLGDFVFPHSSTETGETVIVTTKLSKKSLVATLTPVYLSTEGIPAVVTGSHAAAILKRVKDLSALLQTKVTITGNVATITIEQR